MKKNVLIKIIVLLSLTTFLSSCIDDDYDLNNISDNMSLDNMVLQAPIGIVETTLQEVLAETSPNEVAVEGDLIYLTYKDTLKLTPNNPPVLSTLPVTDYFAAATGTEFNLTSDQSFNLSPSGARIDSATLVNSQIKIDVYSNLATDAQFSVILPDGLELENPAEGIFTVSPGVTMKYLNVKDNSILRIDDIPARTIEVQYVLNTPSTQTINNTDVRVDFRFNQLDMNIFWGFLGNVVYSSEADTIRLNFFNDVVPEGSKLYFSNPTVICKVLNYVGMSSTFYVNYAKAWSNDGLEQVFADFNGSPNYSFVLDAAPQINQASENIEIFDRDNGGTNQLFLINPTYLSYSFSNSPILIPGQNHFIVRNKYVDVAVEAKLPFHFDEGTFLITNDTMDLDLTGEDAIEDVKKMEVRIKYENFLPAAIKLDAVFLDEFYQPITSLNKKFDVPAPTIDSEGYSTKQSEGFLYINFIESDFADVTRVKYIQLKTRTVAFDSTSKMKFRPDDYIHVKADLYVLGDIKF